jgi:hypothetical protein
MFKRKSDDELRAEIDNLKSKHEAVSERQRLENEYKELKYGRAISASKKLGYGLSKAGKAFGEYAQAYQKNQAKRPAQTRRKARKTTRTQVKYYRAKPRRRKIRKRQSSSSNNFGAADFGNIDWRNF